MGVCTRVCQCVCVSVAPLAPAGLENHPRGTGRSHACELGSFPSLWPQSLDPPRRLSGPWPRGTGPRAGRAGRPGHSSGPGERWARPGSSGLALGVDSRVGLPSDQPQGRPQKAPGLHRTVAKVPVGGRVSLCPRRGCARHQQVNLKEGRKGRLPYQDRLAQPPLCLSRATCPQELLGTVGRDLHSEAHRNLLETF